MNRFELFAATICLCLSACSVASESEPSDPGLDTAAEPACAQSKVINRAFHFAFIEFPDDFDRDPKAGMFTHVSMLEDGTFSAKQARCDGCTDLFRVGTFDFLPSDCNPKRIRYTFKNGEVRVYDFELAHVSDEYDLWLGLHRLGTNRIIWYAD